MSHIVYITDGDRWPLAGIYSSGPFNPAEMTSEKLRDCLLAGYQRYWGSLEFSDRKMFRPGYLIFIALANTPGINLTALLEYPASRIDSCFFKICVSLEEFDEWLVQERLKGLSVAQ